MRRCITLMLVFVMGIIPLASLAPAAAQDDGCGSAPPPRLEIDRHANVLAGQTVTLHTEASTTSPTVITLADTRVLQVFDGPVCAENTYWWMVSDGMDFGPSWVQESFNGAYVIEPYQFVPAPPVPLGIPMAEPQITSPETPLPAAQPLPNPATLITPYAAWNWAAFIKASYYQAPDPLALVWPDAYAGDLPVPPVNLDTVHFVQDANLNPQQLALLAQNGFVVVPGNVAQFDMAYEDEGWTKQEGKGDFITTDALLYSFYLAYQNALMFLEQNGLYAKVTNAVGGGLEAASAQAAEAAGTPLEVSARNAAIYYAVALMLLSDGESAYVLFDGAPAFKEGDRIPSTVLGAADPAILDAARPLVEMARQAEGRLQVPILEDYDEDFSQYRPRSYYAGSSLLESYFRAMMWLGRITFTARSETDTLTGLLVLRALQNSGGAYNDWAAVSDILTFLVGPVDDFGPPDYLPLAEKIFGVGLPLNALSDPALLTQFRAEVANLPGPRINSIPLPLGTPAEQVDELTRGFRLFGQRFTLDGYIMQQLIYPEVGTSDYSRVLPLGLDIAAVLGSDMAYALADEAGATEYANYTEHVAALRDEVNTLDSAAWFENLYGGWLWTLQPLLVRFPDLIPPMMQTDAWKRKEITTALGSWTTLKHATLLYAEQPYGGLGGGGMIPPVISYSYVEPNPLVFARIAVAAALLYQGLDERGLLTRGALPSGLDAVRSMLLDVGVLSAQLAEMARKEVAGEALSYDELYFLQEDFRSRLWYIRFSGEEWISEPPENTALIADVATNSDANLVLEVAIGTVDYIYVVTNSPSGLQLTRGGVFSYFEFAQNIDQRLTDQEWRAMLASGQVPPRPAWTGLYYSE